MRINRLAKLACAGMLGAACLVGTPQRAAAISPVVFSADYFANLPLLASRLGQFVGFTVRVNSVGVQVDAQTISPLTQFSSQGVANCLGDPFGTVSYDVAGDSPLSVADDFRLVCPFSRGDEVYGAVAILQPG